MNVLIELNVIRNNVTSFKMLPVLKKSLFFKKIIFDIFPDTPIHKVRLLSLAYNIQIPI